MEYVCHNCTIELLCVYTNENNERVRFELQFYHEREECVKVVGFEEPEFIITDKITEYIRAIYEDMNEIYGLEYMHLVLLIPKADNWTRGVSFCANDDLLDQKLNKVKSIFETLSDLFELSILFPKQLPGQKKIKK
jgi:hypothetical protein